MAHVGQELALGAARRLGDVHGLAHRLLGALAFGDLVEDDDRALDPAVLQHGRDGVFHRNGAPVLVPVDVLRPAARVADAQHGEDRAIDDGIGAAVGAGVVQQRVQAAPQQLLVGIAGDRAGGGVGEGDAPVAVHPADAVRGRLQDQVQPPVGPGEGAVGLFQAARRGVEVGVGRGQPAAAVHLPRLAARGGQRQGGAGDHGQQDQNAAAEGAVPPFLQHLVLGDADLRHQGKGRHAAEGDDPLHPIDSRHLLEGAGGRRSGAPDHVDTVAEGRVNLREADHHRAVLAVERDGAQPADVQAFEDAAEIVDVHGDVGDAEELPVHADSPADGEGGPARQAALDQFADVKVGAVAVGLEIGAVGGVGRGGRVLPGGEQADAPLVEDPDGADLRDGVGHLAHFLPQGTVAVDAVHPALLHAVEHPLEDEIAGGDGAADMFLQQARRAARLFLGVAQRLLAVGPGDRAPETDAEQGDEADDGQQQGPKPRGRGRRRLRRSRDRVIHCRYPPGPA